MEIKLTMDRERAIMLSRALETIARLGICQFAELAEMMKPMIGWDDKKEIEKYLMEKLKPGHENSIRNDKVSEQCQVAWDAYQHIRREIAWYDVGKDWRTDSPDSSMAYVTFDTPMKVSKLPGDFKTERV